MALDEELKNLRNLIESGEALKIVECNQKFCEREEFLYEKEEERRYQENKDLRYI